MRDDLCSGRGDNSFIAAGVIMMLVGVENLRDLPAFRLGRGKRLLMVDRIDCKCLACFRASDQVIEITVGVVGPDSLDNHRALLIVSYIMREAQL